MRQLVQQRRVRHQSVRPIALHSKVSVHEVRRPVVAVDLRLIGEVAQVQVFDQAAVFQVAVQESCRIGVA